MWYDACVKELRDEGLSVITDVIEGCGEPIEYKEKNKEEFSIERIKAYFNT